ncbi:APC amino acid permease [Cylindrobasidium torrendii FP15055 ss-10]|uniref:APC amino acid permease n=1 Tax=Cylindrobasidium torrendii FP15055 ss-10 TaxID=1314674 RepID=A0A0D7AYI5_9AGAR|nr:APC amino acid permease [Cylindrobasidium torrendii FP15055 ss-10]
MAVDEDSEASRAPLLHDTADNSYGSTHRVVTRVDNETASESHGHGEQFDNVPKDKRKLGLFSAASLIFNRLIGTGIFATPSLILHASGSVGVALCMWLCGAVIAAIGTTVYIELGSALPRSGGEKNYLEYIFRKPAFLVTCIFAVYALIMGSSASNSLVFSEYFLNALSVDATPFHTRVTAFICLTLCAFLQGTSVRTGLFLQNTLAVFKLVLLLFFVVSGLLALLGILPPTEYPLPSHPFRRPFEGSTTDASVLISGMYNVIWAFVGYNAANSALSEVRNPVWTVKRAAPLALGTVTVVYLLVNVAYFAVVEKADILSGRRIVAALFFRNLFGKSAERILSLCISLSTLGNLLGGHFHQGRMLQELGREGTVPYASFFASSQPFGAPLAALAFQWAFNVILIVLPPESDAYAFMINLSSYCNNIVGVAVALGLVLLSSSLLPFTSYKWDPPFKASRVVVVTFMLVNVFLLAMPFVPPKDGRGYYQNMPYYAHALAGCLLSIIGVIYWYLWSRIMPSLGKYRLERDWVVGEDGVGRNVFKRVGRGIQ